MTADPKFLYPNDDKGRAQIIAFIQARIDDVRPKMPMLSNLKLNADVKVKRVPEDIQDGAGLGYMNFASLDGKRPAIYYVNLKDTGYWPSYTLASLTVVTGSSTVDPDRSNNVSTLNFGAAELQAVPVPLSPTLSALVGGLLALCGAAALRRGRAP